MKPSLVVLAAGMGSRYGSLKQIDKYGPSGETIIDYSIYDALEAGFGNIVFVIRKSFEAEFKEAYGDKYSSRADVHFVFQEMENIPAGFTVPPGREKPWGTAHAVLMAKEYVNTPFAIINGDDYYGKKSFQAICQHLNSMSSANLSACLIGYVLRNTLSENGKVSRGICEVDQEGSLSSIVERTEIYKGTKTDAYYIEDDEQNDLTGDEIVSMNLMGFSAGVFGLIETEFEKFLSLHGTELKSEFYIPFILDKVKEQGIKVPVIMTQENWFGVTYKEDKQLAQRKLQDLVNQGVYPKKLW